MSPSVRHVGEEQKATNRDSKADGAEPPLVQRVHPPAYSQAKQLLIALFDGRDERMFVNLAAFKADGGKPKYENPTLQAVRSTNVVDQFITDNNDRNLHFCPNLLERAPKNGKAAASDLAPIHTLYVDLDPPKELGTDIEAFKTSCQDKLSKLSLPMSMLDTGGGLHGLITFDQAVEVSKAIELNEMLCMYLEADKAVKNPVHLSRLPGTTNYPNKKKRQAGREACDATLLSIGKPISRSSLDHLVLVAGLDISDDKKRLAVFGPDGDQDESAARYSVTLAMCRAGHDDETILEVTSCPDLGIAPKQEKNKAYYAAQIVKARKAVKEYIPEHVRWMNERYFVTMFEGRCVIVQDGEAMTFTSKAALNDFFANDPARVHDGEDKSVSPPVPKYKSVPRVPLWMQSKHRRQYTELVLRPDRDPGEQPDGSMNMWRGYSVEPIAGDTALFDELMTVICETPLQLDYALNWLARLIQYPEKVGEVAFVMQGDKGTGKGTLAWIISQLFGRHFIRVASSEHMTGRFNGHLLNCVVLFADEALWAGDKRAESSLKAMITEDRLTIEPKHLPVTNVVNRLTVIMASNARWVIPASADERRFFVVKLSNKRQKDTKFFGELRARMNDGGLSAVLHQLLNRDISKFDVYDVPSTKALEEQQQESMDDFDAFWLDELMDSSHGVSEESTGGDWEKSPTGYLFNRFQNHQRARTIKRGGPSSKAQFGKRLSEVLPDKYPKQGSRMSWKVSHDVWAESNSYLFPHIDVCRRCFDEYIGRKHDWAEVQSSDSKDVEAVGLSKEF